MNLKETSLKSRLPLGDIGGIVKTAHNLLKSVNKTARAEVLEGAQGRFLSSAVIDRFWIIKCSGLSERDQKSGQFRMSLLWMGLITLHLKGQPIIKLRGP